MRVAVIVDGFRTGFCKQGTVLKDTPPELLGAFVVREMTTRMGFLNLKPSDIDYVVGSNVATPPNAPTLSRISAVRGGLPESIPAQVLTQNCGSGIAAVDYASNLIRVGRHNTVLVVGVESMSRIPLIYQDTIKRDFESLFYARTAKEKIGFMLKLLPKQIRVWKKEYQPKSGLMMGLTDVICDLIMGLTAENLAKNPLLHITREEQDAFALRSHQKASATRDDKLFDQEISKMFLPNYKSFFCLDQDNGIRSDINPKLMSKAKPFFDKKYGTVTAGNSSQITDGAACILLMSEEKARALGIPVLGHVVDYADVGFKPEIMGLSPVGAIAKVLKQNKMKISDFSVIEINEAFAAQTLACLKTMNSSQLMNKWFSGYGFDKALGEINDSQLNPRGGAIALGHPIGVSGMRLVITALNELKTRNHEYALISACIGGGQGNAMILRRS